MSGPPRVGRTLPDDAAEQPPLGQAPLLAAGLSIGLLLLAVQLWLLTVALDMMLGGRAGEVWSLAAVSGLIFAGGLGVLWGLGRRPRVARQTAHRQELN
jgi:hypothetical protein